MGQKRKNSYFKTAMGHKTNHNVYLYHLNGHLLMPVEMVEVDVVVRLMTQCNSTS